MLESPFKGVRIRVIPGRVPYLKGTLCPACHQPVEFTQIITVWEGKKLIMLAEVCGQCEYLISKNFPNGTRNRKLADTIRSAKYLTELYESLYSKTERGST